MNLSSKTKKFGQSPVAAACVSLVIGMASASALAQSASFGINFPVAAVTVPTPEAAVPTQIQLGGGLYALDADFGTIPGMANVALPVHSVQTVYNGGVDTPTLKVETTLGENGILNNQSGGGTVTADVSNNSIAGSATGNQVTLSNVDLAATIDLGLLSTNNSIGALAVQFLGGQSTAGQVNVQVNVSGSTVGALFKGMSAAPITVSNNVVKATSTLNDATTLVAGTVPLGFADDTDDTGGSSTIGFAATATTTGDAGVSADSDATLSINTLQGTVNGGIRAGSIDGSYAALTDNTIAIKTQTTAGNLSSPLTLNNNTQSATFTGNKATSVLEADASSNAFSGSASVTNAQANVETLVATSTSPTAEVSNSQIVADLTYRGVGVTAGASSTLLTSSLSVSGTAAAPQSISAQSIGNAAGSLSSAGQLTSSGNALEFRNSAVNLTGSSSATDVTVSAATQTADADFIVNSAQVNQSATSSGSGVSSLVTASGITAAVDRLAAAGTVTANYNAATAGATGNLAGNLINAQGSNITASMAVVGTQQNTNAGVLSDNLGTRIGVGIGDSTGTTVAQRGTTTAVSGSVTVNNNAIGAVAQGNLAANTLLASAGNTLTAQISGGSVSNSVSSGGASVNAGLVAVNVQGNAGSAATATVSGGSVFIAGVDQAGDNKGNLVPLGAATLTASSNRISALAQGNNGGTNIGASAGGAMALTAAAANSQSNDSTSPVEAVVDSSRVLVSGLSSVGTTIATNSNTLTADATGNLGVNAISISGGSTVNGQNTSKLQSLQDNLAAITASASGSAVGVLLGAASSNVGSYPYNLSDTKPKSDEPTNTSTASSTFGSNTFADMLNRNVTTVTGATLDVNTSTVAASATANQVDNRASLSGTALGGIAPVASVLGSVLGSVQNNYGAVGSSVVSTDVGVRLANQSNTVSSIPTYSSSAETSNTNYVGDDQDLNTASAVAANSVSGSGSGYITAIDATTASVSGTTLAAASSANTARNSLRLSGTDVTLQSGAALWVDNDQTNSATGDLTASVSDANVGVIVRDEITVPDIGVVFTGVTGTGTSTLIGTVEAKAVPTAGSPNGLFSGSASATIGALDPETSLPVATLVVGDMAATGFKALTAEVDDSKLSAASVANSADNRITVSATALATGGTAANALVTNSQSNQGDYGATMSAVNLGVVLADVTSVQSTTASGSTTANVVATDNSGNDGSSVVDGAFARTTLSASGSATAMGIDNSTLSVQRSALSASAKGNTVTNVIDLGSTVANAFGVSIANGNSADVGQYNNASGSASIGGVALGTVVGPVDAASTSTSTADATASGSATDTTSASVTNSSATASGSATADATATGLRNSTSTVSGSSLAAAVFGNEAINVASGSGTVIGSVSSQAAAKLVNWQVNDYLADLTATVGGTDTAAVQLGTLVGAVTAGGDAIATSTASGSATALATKTDVNGESTTAEFDSIAVARAFATVNATGISGLTAATDSNLVEAANTGNSAVNAIRLSGVTMAGSTGASTLVNENIQTNGTNVLEASASNIALGVMLTSVDARGSTSGSSSATASAVATDAVTLSMAEDSGETTNNLASAIASGGATSEASGSATAVGIEATKASVASNVLRAANTGNSARTLTSLSASSLTSIAGFATVSGSSTQTNRGSMSATLGDTSAAVTVGVSGGAVTAIFVASGGATATSAGDATANNWYEDLIGGDQWDDASRDTASPVLSTTAKATANATATATGMTGSTFSVLSNQLEASNVANSAYTSAVLDGTVLGTAAVYDSTGIELLTAAAPVSATQSNTQTNDSTGSGTATATNIKLGVMQGAVSAKATGIDSYSSTNTVINGVIDAIPQGNDPEDTVTGGGDSSSSTANAFAYGIVNSNLTVGGTAKAPQTVTAQSVGNSATTLIDARQTTGVGPSASATLALTSLQTNNGNQTATVGEADVTVAVVTVGVKLGAVKAEAIADSGTATAVGISGGSTAVQYNTLAAKTFGNSAVNSVASTTTTSLTGSTAGVDTFSATNTQTNTAITGSTVGGADIGVFVGNVTAIAPGTETGTVTALAINAAQLNVSNNQSLATSMGNVADNSVAVSAGVAGSSLPVSSLVSSGQTNDGAQTALVDALRVGVFTGAVAAGDQADGIKASSLTVNSNQLQAATYGNSASNVNELLAANTASIGAVSTSNVQLNGLDGSGPSTVSNTTVGVGISTRTAQDWALVTTPTTVQANTLAALSYGNSATNSTSVSGGTTLSANTAANAFETVNDQTNHASMVSLAEFVKVGVMVGTVDGDVASGNGLDRSPTVVKDNAVSVLAYANQATNSLSLTAGNVIDGNGKLARVSNLQTSTVTPVTDGETTTFVGNAESTLSNVTVGVFVNATGTDVNNSAITVEGNRLTAASYLNTATNTLSLAAQVLGGVETTTPATVTNWQSNAASGSGTISGVNVGVMPHGAVANNALTLNDVTSTVSNNALNAQAGGNTAQNVLNATASATIAGGVNTPTFQVLNSQSNNGVMTALLENVNVGNWGNAASSNYYGPTTMTVSLNTAMANAYGNTASNALSMSALTGASNSASTGLSNSQSNTANLSATVNGVLMGVGSGRGTGTVAVSGNSIVASTVGNAASNRVGIVR